MEELLTDRLTKFFTLVWRINGLIVFGLGVLGLVLAVLAILEIARFRIRERPQEQITRVADKDLAASNLRLGSFEEIPGTKHLYAELFAPSEYYSSKNYSSKNSGSGSGAAHNLLFFNTATKTAHWLLSDNDHTIPSYSLILYPPRSLSDKAVALGVLLELRKSGQEGSPQQSTETGRLLIAASDGTALTTIASPVDALLGHHLVDRQSLLAFYVAAGAVRVADVDPTTRRTRSDSPLSTAP